MTQDFEDYDKKDPDKWTPACDSPNPPWWCDEQDDTPAAPIDNTLFLVIGVFVAIGYAAYRIRKEENKGRKNDR